MATSDGIIVKNGREGNNRNLWRSIDLEFVSSTN